MCMLFVRVKLQQEILLVKCYLLDEKQSYQNVNIQQQWTLIVQLLLNACRGINA